MAVNCNWGAKMTRDYILKENEYLKFWITWKDGYVQVGEGPIVNDRIVLQ